MAADVTWQRQLREDDQAKGVCARHADSAVRCLGVRHSLTRSWGSRVCVCSQICGRDAIKGVYSYPEQVDGAQVVPAHLRWQATHRCHLQRRGHAAGCYPLCGHSTSARLQALAGPKGCLGWVTFWRPQQRWLAEWSPVHGRLHLR